MPNDNIDALGKSRRTLEDSRLKLALSLGNEMVPLDRHEVIEQLREIDQAIKVIVEILNKGGR